MGAIEDLTAAIQTQEKQLEQLAAEISTLRAKVQPQREVYTLKDVAELPESPSLKTLRNRPELAPRGGVPDGYRGSQKCWYRETVENWRRELAPGPGSVPLHVVHGRASEGGG